MPATSVSRRLGLDAGDLELVEDPPPLPGDLRDDLDHFTSLEECVTRRVARLDPVLGDALEALGYESFARDACRLLEAIKSGRSQPCDLIDASSLRRRCITFVAMSQGEADLCPLHSPPKLAEGRDPFCLALASRDARLCAAAQSSDRRLCEALALRDERRCDGARRPARCRRDIARWKRMGGDPRPLSSAVVPEGELEVDFGAGNVPQASKTQIASIFARGLVLEERIDGFHVELAPRLDRSLDTPLSRRPAEPRANCELVLSRKTGEPARLTRFELEVPGTPRFSCSGPACSLDTKVLDEGLTRGSSLRLSVAGDMAYAGRRVRVNLVATTFVRDVVTLAQRSELNRR